MAEESKITQATGYPHIDNVHRAYYPKIDIVNNTDQSMYRYLLSKTAGFDGTAISFYGEEISFDELKIKILKYAKSFYHMGVKPGDTVTFLMPSCPETYYMFYALDVIGAKRNMVDLRTSVDGIQKYINDAESDFFVCLEDFPVRYVKQLMDKTATKKVLVADIPFHALDKKIQPIAKGIMAFKEIGFRRLGSDVVALEDFKTFFRHVDSRIDVETKVDSNLPSMYVHTSGTTGFPKTVMVSDKAQNFVADQYEKSLMPFDPHDRFLAIMPPWIIYGILAFHTSFALRMNVFPVLDPSKEKFDKLILDTKANHVAGVPNHVITLLDSPLIKPDTGLSHIKTFACGGAAINSEKQDEGTAFLQAHGSSATINPGYSLSENNSIGTVNQGEYVKDGSVGILLPDLEGMVIDINTGEPLKFNEEGIVCLRGDGSMMNGYLNDPEETSKVIKNIDGKDWVITGDIGHFDEDGFLFLNGRQKNLITAPDGFKIAPNEIEAKICKHEAVKNCVVFGVKDPDYEFGDYVVAYVELKDDKASQKERKKIFQEIKQICDEQLSSYYRPKKFYCGKIQYTPMMKDDKKKMKEMFEEEQEKSPIRRKNIY